MVFERHCTAQALYLRRRRVSSQYFPRVASQLDARHQSHRYFSCRTTTQSCTFFGFARHGRSTNHQRFARTLGASQIRLGVHPSDCRHTSTRTRRCQRRRAAASTVGAKHQRTRRTHHVGRLGQKRHRALGRMGNGRSQ